MPLFYQQHINQSTRLAIWKIEESESFFAETVPLKRDITHPHKRLQHLAGRYLLRFLFPIKLNGSMQAFTIIRRMDPVGGGIWLIKLTLGIMNLEA
jgi:hypothetical protein